MPNAMHSLDSNSSTVPAFLVKLWKLVEDPTCDYLIAWNDSGLSFIIKDQSTFAKDLLPQYFKHSNMASFIRQLNMYGFKKVLNIEKSGLKNDNNEMEFHHGCFRKGRSELLELIKRKISNPRTITETPVVKTNAKDILIDLTTIREKQESMDSMLLKMKSENESLWRELTTMRQKHKQQEQIIQKVIQFLVSIVQRNPNIGVQRKLNRMLHSSPSSKANSSQVSRTIDVLRKNSDCIMVPEQIVSPLGPVIHEVLDGDHEDSPAFITSQNSNVPSPCVKSPESIKESNEDANPKYHLVSLLNNPSEHINILEALTPKAPAATTENNESECIFGLPLEYVTIPGDIEVTNVISIPDSDSVISIPEDVVINNAISIPEGCSTNNIMVHENSSSDATNQGESSKNILNSSDKLTGVEETPPDFLSNIVSFGDLQQPIISQDMIEYPCDFQDDLSESLQTPKVHVPDEEHYIPIEKISKQNNKSAKKNQVNSNSTHDEHNYQLATTEPSSLSKNVLSNHLVSVKEKLVSTKDQLTNQLNPDDVQKLLNLFSNDELVNYDAYNNGQLSDDMIIKTEPSDIIGNELVQFFPNNMLEIDITNSPLFEALTENPEVPNEDLGYQPTSLLHEVLNETAASEAANFSSDEMQLNLSPNKRSKPAAKTSKGKRRKVK